MTQVDYIFIGTATLTVCALFASGLLFWRLNRISRELVSVKQKLNSPAPRPAAPPQGFSKELLSAELKTELLGQPGLPHSTDRYRYVAALAKNGLSAEQIAAVLSLGRGEAEQLVTLSLLHDRQTAGSGQAEPVLPQGYGQLGQLGGQLA